VRAEPAVRAVGTVQSVDRSLRIVEILADHPNGLGLSELSTELGLSQGTAHRLLRTLGQRRWVRQDASRRYVLGSALVRIGTTAGGLLAAAATSYLHELVALWGESANLAALEGDHVVYVAQVPSSQRLRTFAEVGHRVPAHSTGVGKVLLAYLPPPEASTILERGGLAPRTPRTITDIAVMARELELVRRRGYALDDGEEELGVRCIAVPVHDRAERAAAALSISGPEARLGALDVEDIARQMRAIAARFGTVLTSQGPA
jgi:IclR family acetate operon transcriptional repressor